MGRRCRSSLVYVRRRSKHNHQARKSQERRRAFVACDDRDPDTQLLNVSVRSSHAVFVCGTCIASNRNSDREPADEGHGTDVCCVPELACHFAAASLVVGLVLSHAHIRRSELRVPVFRCDKRTNSRRAQEAIQHTAEPDVYHRNTVSVRADAEPRILCKQRRLRLARNCRPLRVRVQLDNILFGANGRAGLHAAAVRPRNQNQRLRRTLSEAVRLLLEVRLPCVRAVSVADRSHQRAEAGTPLQQHFRGRAVLANVCDADESVRFVYILESVQAC